MIHAISSAIPHQSSFEDAGISLTDLSNQGVTLRSNATPQASLRSPPLARHLHLIDEVPEIPNSEFMNLLMSQLNSGVAPEGVRTKPAWMQFMVRHRALLRKLGYGVASGSVVVTVCFVGRLVSLAIQMNGASFEKYQTLQLEFNKAFSTKSGLLGLTFLSSISTVFLVIFLERAARNVADPFLNGPNDGIDQNIVDPNELNNQPQNVHAASTNRTHFAAFQALRSAINNPIDKTLAKDHILEIFDYLCEGESDFKREMIALNRSNNGTDTEKLHSVKDQVGNAIDFMIGEAQANRTPMHYPPTVTSSAVLTHVWSCIEHLSMAGYEDQARLLTENLIKALHASHGFCNTGHVSRLLQALGDTIRFGFNNDTHIQDPLPVITPQDFYTLNQNDLNHLVSEVVNTHSTRAQLHDLEQEHPEDLTAYKESATLIVKGEFISQLGRYLVAHHALVLQSNPQLQEDLMRFLETDFAAFIDNARDDEDMNSVASFSF